MDEPLKILLIEDNPGDAFLIKFYLEESMFKDAHLIHAEFLKTGLDLISKNSFNVILLDLNLPESKGIETLEEVLDAVDDSLVIVLTGLSDEELGVQTVKMGAQDFLVKGQFDGKVLASSIRYAFERYQLQKQVNRANRLLDTNAERLNKVQHIAGFAYWELNLNDKNIFRTRALNELLNLDEDKETLTLNELLAMVQADDATKLEASFKKAIEDGTEFKQPFQLKNGNGSLVCEAYPEMDGTGKLTNLIGVIKPA